MMRWPNENGNPVEINELSNSQLQRDTQRLVDTCRNQCARELYKLSQDLNTMDFVKTHSHNTSLNFKGRVIDMIVECQRRGIEINLER